MAELSSFHLRPGDPAPDFSLPSTNGSTVGLHDFDSSELLLVTFWCNHCPYVQAWEGRLIELARRYETQGLQVVAINSNETENYPGDRFEAMVERAKRFHYPFPYLRDESQQVARAYGGLVTPHPMLFGPDRKLLFQGRIDDNHEHPERVRTHFLADAIDASLAHRRIEPAELPVLGCSIKWRA
ncbi:MAG: thioredoxin family protein [Thermoplasmata archaeon]|nr:thioredoxin family protein [Thermoplasmata archaeon]